MRSETFIREEDYMLKEQSNAKGASAAKGEGKCPSKMVEQTTILQNRPVEKENRTVFQMIGIQPSSQNTKNKTSIWEG